MDVIMEEQLHVIHDGNLFTPAGIELALVATTESFAKTLPARRLATRNPPNPSIWSGVS